MREQPVHEGQRLARGTRRVPRASWASDSARPCDTVTLRTRAGRAPAWPRGCRRRTGRVPSATMPMTRRRTPGMSGPAVDQVADEDGRAGPRGCVGADGRPVVVRGRCQPELGRAGCASSAAQPCTSPMRSKGPCSSRAVVPRPLPHDLDRRDLVGARVSTCTRRKPSLRSRAERPLQVAVLAPDDVAAEVPVGAATRCARAHTDSGTSSTIASTSASWLRASVDERGARLRLHVGRVDDGEQAAAQPGADDVVQDVEGVRRWPTGRSRRRRRGRGRSRSRRPRSARSARAAKVDLPLPGDADEHHQAARCGQADAAPGRRRRAATGEHRQLGRGAAWRRRARRCRGSSTA